MGAKLNPQICPTNPELVAYICNHDIWVTHTVSGSNVRITYAHKGKMYYFLMKFINEIGSRWKKFS